MPQWHCSVQYFYFRNNLYLVSAGNSTGITSEIQGGAARLPGSSPRHLTFNVGDKVKVLMDVEALKQMQEGHGGWNPRMAEVSLFSKVLTSFDQQVHSL
jgi:E3 ubiquitin-protein ligase mind-bomb